MKKYIKPLMESEVFVASEYIGACKSTTKLACLNMNIYDSIYQDIIPEGQTEGDGILSAKEMEGENHYKGEKYDCDTNGDTTGKKHTLSNVDQTVLYFVGKGQDPSKYVAAYKAEDGDKPTPHYVSMASVINASN